MKKLVGIFAFVFLGFNCLSAQTEFGVSAGFNSLSAKASVDGISVASNVSGFYVGVFADIKTSEKFHIQPELQYVNLTQDGLSGNMLVMPLLGKYYASEKFNVQFGPQLDLIIDDSDGVNAFGFGLSAGIGYDISDKFSASIRYTLGLNNRLQDGEADDVDGVDVKFNFFQIGLKYKI